MGDCLIDLIFTQSLTGLSIGIPSWLTVLIMGPRNSISEEKSDVSRKLSDPLSLFPCENCHDLPCPCWPRRLSWYSYSHRTGKFKLPLLLLRAITAPLSRMDVRSRGHYNSFTSRVLILKGLSMLKVFFQKGSRSWSWFPSNDALMDWIGTLNTNHAFRLGPDSVPSIWMLGFHCWWQQLSCHQYCRYAQVGAPYSSLDECWVHNEITPGVSKLLPCNAKSISSGRLSLTKRT